MASLVGGMDSNGLLRHTHLLTGYIGSAAMLRSVVLVAERLRQLNPDLVYVCDPVMGDNGRLYVAADLPAAYRESIVPLASILTPNAFEAEQLTGLPVRTEAEALAACCALHDRGPHTVVVSSLQVEGDVGHVTIVASTRLPQRAGGGQRLRLRVPRIDAYFTGTGDLFTALLLARLHREPDCLGAALEAAVASLQAVLRDTAAEAGDAVAQTLRSAEVCRRRELRLIQNQAAIREPTVKVLAEVLR